ESAPRDDYRRRASGQTARTRHRRCQRSFRCIHGKRRRNQCAQTQRRRRGRERKEAQTRVSATADALPPASDGRGVALLHTEAHTIIMKPIFQNFPQRWSLHLLVLLSLNLAGPSLAFAQEEK